VNALRRLARLVDLNNRSPAQQKLYAVGLSRRPDSPCVVAKGKPFSGKVWTMRLRRTKDMWDFTIAAVDADIGRVHDFYFDDETWTIRYIVVETGTVLAGRKVLISPTALCELPWSSLHLRATLTCEQIDRSPSIDLHKPISRQREIEHHKHYGWPYYWLGEGIWGSHADPATLGKAPTASAPSGSEKPSPDAHLRSIREVTGYHVSAVEGEIGHVEDFLFDDMSWEIRYAIIDAKNRWAGERVLISPRWIKRVSWKNRTMYLDLSRDRIRNSPQWDPDQPVSRNYELELHKHYAYTPYWTRIKSGEK
jgi:hypothetical protein